MLFAQRLGLESLLVDDIAAALLAEVLAQRAVAPAPTVLEPLHVVCGPLIGVLGLLDLLVVDRVQPTDDVRVERDHIRLQLRQQRVHLAFLALVGILVWVCFQRVEVGLAGAWHDETCETLVVSDAEDIFVWAPAHVLDTLTISTPRHVRAVHLALVRDGGVE